MRIGDMFLKPIDRDIKGVIKVGQDDGANIFQELDEYVVTRELSKHFREFFSSYKRGINGNTDKMGVWISGFFGSGKSHFLKILSYLLENREVNGKRAIEYFTDSNKIADPMVLADIKLAGNTGADVILFNIDSKSAADAKSNKDAIVEVFMKVFNEMQGFCSSMPFLADFERKLAADGDYDRFKLKFQEISSKIWEETRAEFYFIQDDLIKTLSALDIMSEDSARIWCEKANDTYKLSIEKFADMVRKYCESKGRNHHVVFLVDEIGQYIAEDTRLMLNLQTVTEDLGTACGGRAWIIVTSQQDIDSFTKVKGNDFSKIQGRFDTRLSLSSANVDEVIRKRILSKNETATQTLTLLYDQKESILKNLITFTTDTADKKLYSDRIEFAEVYPFIPYQFNLLGQVLTSIRTHGASGKHLAEGERSMIALFKESAAHYMDSENGIIVPFDIFYNALDKFIDHTHSIVISQASLNSSLVEFDVKLLKVLFMVKYVKEIKTNIDNLTTLMVSNIDDDRIELKKKIEESLKRLIKQTLVQKNGESYMFLTNEEQDINKAIQNEAVEMGEIINEASTIIFQELISESKYRYSARYNFSYNQIVDDRYYRNVQSNGMGVKIITPYNDNSEGYSVEALRMLSAQEDNVIIHMPNDTTFLDEISEAIKINKFITKPGSITSKTFESIKRAKQDELIEKKTRIKIFIEDALKNADIYVNGDKTNISAKDPASRINEAIGKLVGMIYNKLSYMETSPLVSDLENIFATSNQMSLGGAEGQVPNRLALDDVLSAIDLNSARHMKTSMKALIDRFSAPPYGFVDLDIQWLVLMLFKQGKVSFTVNSLNISLVSTSAIEIVKFATKREYIEKLLIEKREKATERQIKSAKEIMKDLFGMTTISEEDDALIKVFKNSAKNKAKEIENLLIEYRLECRFPSQNILTNAKKILDEINTLDNPMEFFKYVDNNKDEFLDIAEDIAPIISFFTGEQKAIFAKTLKYVDIFEHSKTYVVDTKLISLVETMKQIIKKQSPFSEIHKLPDLNAKFESLHVALLEKESEPIHIDLENDKMAVLDALNKKDFADSLKQSFLSRFEELKNRLETSNEVATVKNIRHESDALKIRCLNEIAEYERKLLEEQKKNDIANANDVNIEVVPVVKTKNQKNISIKQLANTVSIENKTDIDNFLSSLKTKLEKELEENTVINLMM